MKKITIKEILNATDGKLIAGDENAVIYDIKQDSRVCDKGDMFVAFIGEVHDAHKFVKDVLDGECDTVFISDLSCLPEDLTGKNIIQVSDTTYQLGELARWYLDSLNVKKIAVTGSVGKTSTRDIIYYALSKKYKTGKNYKNYNNAWGLPLSIFRFDEDTEVVVLEIGMNHFGEIDRLADIIRPEIGVLTNIGVSHIENLGSREGIFKAKMEMTKHIVSGGTLVYVCDDEFLTRERTQGDYKQIEVGMSSDSDYFISSVDDFGLEGIQFTVVNNGASCEMKLPLAGVHNALNGSIAIAVGKLLGVTIDQIQTGFNEAELTGSRLKVIKTDLCNIIDDTYNAATASMKSALTVLSNSRCDGRKIAILGDMYEMGDESASQHRDVGAFAKELDIDLVIALGNIAKSIAEAAEGGKAKVMWLETKEELYPRLNDIVGQGNTILVKASRGMKLEDVVDEIKKL